MKQISKISRLVHLPALVYHMMFIGWCNARLGWSETSHSWEEKDKQLNVWIINIAILSLFYCVSEFDWVFINDTVAGGLNIPVTELKGNAPFRPFSNNSYVTFWLAVLTAFPDQEKLSLQTICPRHTNQVYTTKTKGTVPKSCPFHFFFKKRSS